jgi:hypothetical protein
MKRRKITVPTLRSIARTGVAVSLVSAMGCARANRAPTPVVSDAEAAADGTSPIDSAVVRGVERDTLVRECNQQTSWCDFVLEAARDSWLYAQMAENAYGRESFKLPSYISKDTVIKYGGTDFSATIYSRWSGQTRQAIIIAYRGTDFTHWKDWVLGNLFTFQNRQALRLFDHVRDSYSGMPFIVTGHSLGGAMAMHVSLRRDNAEAYVFNMSPHYRTPLFRRADNDRSSVASYAEILKGLRIFTRQRATWHTVVPCAEGDAISRHSQRMLATCLTQIASITSPAADSSRELNHIPRRPAPSP